MTRKADDTKERSVRYRATADTLRHLAGRVQSDMSVRDRLLSLADGLDQWAVRLGEPQTR